MPKQGVGGQIDEEIPAPGLVSSHAAEVVIVAATAADFVVAATGPTQYRLSRTYRPGWVVPTAIVGALFFGLGLLLLILVPKRNETCLATVHDGRRGVTVRLSGVLPRAVVDQIRVGLGGRSAAPVGSPSPITVTPSALPAARPSLSGGVRRSPMGPSPAASSAQTASAFEFRGPVVDPRPVPPAPVEATVARVAPQPARQVVGPAIRIGSELIPLSGGVVIGRNPAPLDALPGARLVAIGDGGLSKTHFAVRVAGSTTEICDLSSTNGTVVETGAVRRPCVPGVWLAVSGASTVVAADQRMDIGP